MNEILLAIGLVTFIVYAVFNIIYLNDVRKTSLALRQFIAKTEANLNPALAELTQALSDIRKVTEDISILVERLRSVVGTVASVEKSIVGLYGYYRDSFGQANQANIAALKAGFKAGVVSLINTLTTRKEGAS
jgi:uncharacterized protein YoxC